MLAIREGRYEEAERHAQEVGPIAQRTQHPGWIGTFAAQFYAIRWAQGRLGELEQVILQRMEANPLPSWEAALAILYSEIDKPEEGRKWFDRLSAGDYQNLAEDDNWLVTLMLAGEAARRLGEAGRAEQIYEIMKPYGDRQVTVGFGFLCEGSGSLGLGQLASAMKRWGDAERHFETAIAFNESVNTPPWLARARYAYAEMLHERGAEGDDERAKTQVNEALATFEELGMAKYVERALALKMELQGVGYGDFNTSIDAVTASVQSEQPDLRTHAAPDGTVTLMFTDIVDSTPLNERLGDQRWMDLLREHNDLVRAQVSAHEGYEVKTEGDGFMLAFSSARRAAECAIAIQRAFADRNETAEEKVQVRAGLHTGGSNPG